MMGNWTDLRSGSGRLVARIDAERRLLEICRNGEEVLVDLDRILQAPAVANAPALAPARLGPEEVKGG